VGRPASLASLVADRSILVEPEVSMPVWPDPAIGYFCAAELMAPGS
jgi:hypothetical protein